MGWSLTISQVCCPDEDEENQQAQVASGDDADGDAESGKNNEPIDKQDQDQTGKEDLGSIRRQNRDFHIVMAFASLYMAMLLSNWGVLENAAAETGETAMWV